MAQSHTLSAAAFFRESCIKKSCKFDKTYHCILLTLCYNTSRHLRKEVEQMNEKSTNMDIRDVLDIDDMIFEECGVISSDR